METAFFGLLGVVLGGFLTTALAAYWQRRNWQLKEATKAYAGLFQAGRREIGILEAMKFSLGLSYGYENTEELIQKGLTMLGPKVNSVFLRFLAQCWLLERDENIRGKIKPIEQGYESYRYHVNLCVDINRGEREANATNNTETKCNVERLQTEKDKYQGPKSDQLLKNLDELQNCVANKYFHQRTFVEQPVETCDKTAAPKGR